MGDRDLDQRAIERGFVFETHHYGGGVVQTGYDADDDVYWVRFYDAAGAMLSGSARYRHFGSVVGSLGMLAGRSDWRIASER